MLLLRRALTCVFQGRVLVVGEALLRIGAPYSTPIQAYAEIRPQDIVQNIIHLKPAEMEQQLAQLDGQRQGKAKQYVMFAAYRLRRTAESRTA